MSAPLSHTQKRYLSQLSDKAFARASAEADGQYFYDDLPATKAREQYRHDQVVQACGKIGLRCCSQDDYKLVEAHFLHLVGEDGKALNAHVQAATEPVRVAQSVLRRELAAARLDWAYAEKICRQQNQGQPISQVAERRVWNLVYTVRNRGNARKRANNPQPSTLEQAA